MRALLSGKQEATVVMGQWSEETVGPTPDPAHTELSAPTPVEKLREHVIPLLLALSQRKPNLLNKQHQRNKNEAKPQTGEM